MTALRVWITLYLRHDFISLLCFPLPTPVLSNMCRPYPFVLGVQYNRYSISDMQLQCIVDSADRQVDQHSCHQGDSGIKSTILKIRFWLSTACVCVGRVELHFFKLSLFRCILHLLVTRKHAGDIPHCCVGRGRGAYKAGGGCNFTFFFKGLYLKFGNCLLVSPDLHE